ncbi:MAG: hypothetical protein GC172_11290 [Phycisphaera sp.]|nr:hypothetical protein [Phycisphaera sp.]
MQPEIRRTPTEPGRRLPCGRSFRRLATLTALCGAAFLLVKPLAGCESGSRRPVSERQSSEKQRSTKERPKWSHRSGTTAPDRPHGPSPVYSAVHA